LSFRDGDLRATFKLEVVGEWNEDKNEAPLIAQLDESILYSSCDYPIPILVEAFYAALSKFEQITEPPTT
jgi:hypothetical protein